MEGIINNFTRNRSSQNTKHIIVSVENINSRDKAKELIGKKVIFKTQTGKDISGEIRSAHGNSGCIRVIFERSLPGQSLGKKVMVA